MAAFGREKLHIAESMLQYLRSHPGLQVFVQGRALLPSVALQVLSCYLTAQECQPPQAHCHVAVPYEDAVQTIQTRDLEFSLDGPPLALLHPCRYLAELGRPILQSGPRLPSLTQQLNAAATRHGCRWCPLFNAEDLIEL